MPRSHKFPSSSSGMNSRPSCGIKQNGAADQEGHHDTGGLGIPEAELEFPQVAELQGTDEHVLLDRLEVLEEQHAQHRRQRHGQHQGAGQGERVGLRHGPEELSLRAGHGKQRHEGAHHDQDGKQQRMVDLVHEELDPLLEGQVGVVARGQVAVDVLDHHDRGIDDDAEIDRPDRQQVRRLAAQEKHREGEQERQGDVDGDDDRGPDIVHEHEQDRDDQRDAEAAGSRSRSRW